MALLFADCASYYANATQAQQGIYNSASGTVASSGLPAGMIESTAWQNCVNFIALPSPSAGPFIFGQRIYFSPLPGSAATILEFLDSSKNVQVLVQLNTNGSLSVYRGTTANLLGTTAAGLISATAVNYLEVKVLCNASTGTIDIHLNGASVLSLSSQNTQGQSTTTIAFIEIVNSIGSVTTYTQSIYVCDTTGSAPANTFLGDIRLWTFHPTANGTYVAWTPNGAASLYQCVSDATPDDDTTYASDATAGDEFSVAYSGGTISGPIVAVIDISRLRKDDAGTTRQIQQLVRSSTTDSLGPTQTLGTSYLYYSQIFATDPATGVAWTNAGVNAIQTGLKTIS